MCKDGYGTIFMKKLQHPLLNVFYRSIKQYLNQLA